MLFRFIAINPATAYLMRKHFLFLSVLLLSLHAFSQPAIRSFSPVSGAPGTVVTIEGSGFHTTAANNIVYFGSVKAVPSGGTDTTLTVTVPSGATYHPLSVTTGNRTAYARLSFLPTFPGTDRSISAS